MCPQARIKINYDITVYYHSKYGTAPSETVVMGTGDSSKPTVYANFEEEDLPTLTSDSAKFLGWYLDQAFTMQATVGNMEVSSVYNDDYKLNLYAKWQETIYIIESDTLTGLANAVRAKTGVSGAMTPAVIGETFENWEVKDKSVEYIEGTLSIYGNNNITSLKSYAFYCRSNLVSVSFPTCKTIGAYAFNSCSNLTFVSLPSCTNIGAYAFNGCSSLTSANFPTCTNIGSLAFGNCTNIVSVNFPILYYVFSRTFAGCTNLVCVSFPACTYIYSMAFTGCSKLESVYLNGSSICGLVNSNAFNGTPIQNSSYIGKFGSIYVPASLVSSYKASTNWATYSNRITSII